MTHTQHIFRGALLRAALLLGALAFATGCGDEEQNTPPEFIGLDPEYRISVGQTLTINVSAKDAEGDAFTLAMENGPPGADFVISGFGRFVWTPAATDAGKASDAVFSATDVKGGRATFRASIFVEASEGQTRFTTSNSRVLDLTRNETLVARVAVQRDDVTEVAFGLENPPQGMTLQQAGGKSAELRWTPTADQIASKLIWGATITAAADQGEAATQNLTLTLVAKSCGEGATEIQHAPVEDQRGAGDYVIEANIESPDGSPIQATLFSRLGGDPNDSGGFDGQRMEAVGGTFRGTIPNPGSIEGQPKDVYYFIVAFSESDRNLGCLARAPEIGLNSFAAFAAGDESCRQDTFEPNNGPQNAAVLTEDTQGVSFASGQLELYGIAICDNDTDYYAVDLEANQGVSVLITYNSDLGDMHLRGLAPDGETVVLESTDMFANESSMLLPAATAGRYIIEVSGDPQGYRMYLSFRDDVDPNCIDNQFEPNEFASNAPVIPEGTYDDLKICPGDKDFYGVRVPRDFTLTARLLFSHEDGDLDFFIRDRNERVVGSSGSSTDNEELVYSNGGGEGESFTLEIRPVNGAVADYSMELVLTEQQIDDCSGDFFEPNDSAAATTGSPIDGNLNNSIVTMCDDANDFYAVNLMAGQTVNAEITFDTMIADLDMEILDTNERIVATSADVDNDEAASYTAIASGIHFVRVFRFSDMGTQQYRLTIDSGEGNVDLPENCMEDTNEENGARALAFPFDEAQTRAVGLCGQDEDWFLVQPSAGDTILTTLDATPLAGGDPGTDLIFELHDSDGEVVQTGTFSNGTFDMNHVSPDTALFFIRIANTSANDYGYTLEALVGR